MLLKTEWPDTFNAASKVAFAELDWEEVQKYHRLAGDKKPKEPWDCNHALGQPCRFKDDEILGLQKLGLKMEVVPYPGAIITKMEGRAAWDYGEVPQAQDILEGRAVQVVIPDMALLLIDEVVVETDCCTDALQGLLDDGWRILAVCPPNAQRRPDYVLGRRRPTDG